MLRSSRPVMFRNSWDPIMSVVIRLPNRSSTMTMFRRMAFSSPSSRASASSIPVTSRRHSTCLPGGHRVHDVARGAAMLPLLDLPGAVAGADLLPVGVDLFPDLGVSLPVVAADLVFAPLHGVEAFFPEL